MKRKVPDQRFIYINDDLDGKSLDQCVDHFQYLISVYGETAKIDIVYGGDTFEYKILWDREETDAEYDKRLLQEQKQRGKDKTEYERLKKIFDPE